MNSILFLWKPRAANSLWKALVPLCEREKGGKEKGTQSEESQGVMDLSSALAHGMNPSQDGARTDLGEAKLEISSNP